MSVSTIPLAQSTLNLDKMDYPAGLSIKYDGVPVKIIIDVVHGSYNYAWVSRQDKPLGGVADDVLEFVAEVSHDLKDGQHVFIFETVHETHKDFKTISGLTRKKEPQKGFQYRLFDCWTDREPDAQFLERISAGSVVVHRMNNPKFKVAEQLTVVNAEDAAGLIKRMQEKHPEEEGFILASFQRTFKPNSRHWDYQKVVVDPMADLRIIGFMEAIDQHGNPKGMVGGLVAEYKNNIIGIGPGKLTHKERTELFCMEVCSEQFGMLGAPKRQWWSFPAPEQARIATIKYKRDDSYDALRQPTFQHWRPERTDTSY